MRRRAWLTLGCAQCAATAWPGLALAQTTNDTAWQAPPRFTRPELSTEEGGLWALMDREETRLRRSPFRIQERALQDYVQGVVNKLAGEHAPDVRVYAMKTPFFNASMAPNGMMQVWSGLLLRMENEAQLAAVLAHEIAHYLQRHTLEQLRSVKARSSFAQFMLVLGPIGLLGVMAALASGFGFNRDQEREADAVGLKLMEQAGYDPRAAAQVWSNLTDELAATPANDRNTTTMLSTHPAPPERRATLEQAAAGKRGELGQAAFAAATKAWRPEWLAEEQQRGRPAESLVLLDRLLRTDPSSAELLYFRGDIRRQRNDAGDSALAMADLQAAAQDAQCPAGVHRALGHLHLQGGDRAAAKLAFETYLQRAPQATDADVIRQTLKEGTLS